MSKTDINDIQMLLLHEALKGDRTKQQIITLIDDNFNIKRPSIRREKASLLEKLKRAIEVLE